MKTRKYGFTIIELMISMVIIGILVTLVSGTFTSSQRKSRDIKRKNDLAQIAKSLEFYYNDAGRYPAGTNGTPASGGLIVGCVPSGGGSPENCSWGGSFSNKSVSPEVVYMAQLPSPSLSGEYYYYEAAIDGSSFQLFSRLENKDDPGVPKNGTVYQAYNGTTSYCRSSMLCNYSITSSNIAPTANHSLANDP